jgi:hypothetical protein
LPSLFNRPTIAIRLIWTVVIWLDLIWTLCPATGWAEGERSVEKNLLVRRCGPLQNAQKLA